MPHEYYAAADGYWQEQDESLMITRYSTYLICCAMAGSKEIGSIEKLWPLETTEKKTAKPLTKEESGLILERAKKIAEKVKKKLNNVEST